MPLFSFFAQMLKIKVKRGSGVCLSVSPHAPSPETTGRISIKFGNEDLHRNLLSKCYFGSYRSDITPTLHESKLNFTNILKRTVYRIKMVR
jgi:hypothetical protein